MAKARKDEILCENMGESWVVLGWFLMKVGAKLGDFCRNLRFLKRGCRAFATVGEGKIVSKVFNDKMLRRLPLNETNYVIWMIAVVFLVRWDFAGILI